jgi:hypothetical protein
MDCGRVVIWHIAWKSPVSTGHDPDTGGATGCCGKPEPLLSEMIHIYSNSLQMLLQIVDIIVYDIFLYSVIGDFNV